MTEKIRLTSAEQALSKLLVFVPQYKINERYYADFAIPELKIDIEVDGSTPESNERDRKRDEELKAQGWMVLRYAEDEIKQLAKLKEPEDVNS